MVVEPLLQEVSGGSSKGYCSGEIGRGHRQHSGMYLLLLCSAVLLWRSEDGQASNVTFTYDNRSQITFTIDENTNIIDRVTTYPSCTLNNTACYVECQPSNNTFYVNNSQTIPVNLTRTTSELTFSTGQFYCTLTQCNISFITKFLNQKNNDTLLVYLKKMQNIRTACPNIIKTIKQLYITEERQTIKAIMTTDPPVTNNTYNLRDLKMTTFNLTYLAQDNNSQQITAQQLGLNVATFSDVSMPIKQLSSTNVVALVAYMSADLFVEAGLQILSEVIRVEAPGNTSVTGLTTTLNMSFSFSSKPNGTPTCQYFNDTGDYKWDSYGCVTVRNNTTIECRCNHMTPFAILLMPVDKIDQQTWNILTIISYIGCGLSTFFTAFSVFTHIVMKNHTQDHGRTIHASLSAAICMLNLSFLVNDYWASQTEDWTCVLIAAILHYSLLCSFTWMAIEALHLYLLLIQVFNTYFRHYITKLSVVGWGIPAVIVGISLSVTNVKSFYGRKTISMVNTTELNSFCFITDNGFFYGNISFFACIFLFNTGILLNVVCKICKLRALRAGVQKDHSIFRDISTVMGLTCLLGTTWGLAFFGQSGYTVPVLYLFCIFNSLQGFSIFMWICCSVKKERSRETFTKSSSLSVHPLPKKET